MGLHYTSIVGTDVYLPRAHRWKKLLKRHHPPIILPFRTPTKCRSRGSRSSRREIRYSPPSFRWKFSCHWFQGLDYHHLSPSITYFGKTITIYHLFCGNFYGDLGVTKPGIPSIQPDLRGANVVLEPSGAPWCLGTGLGRRACSSTFKVYDGSPWV